MKISPEDLEQVDQIFDEFFDAGRSPGLAYAVTYQDQIIYSKGLGVSALDGETPNIQTVFRVASMTKSFTAAAALILRDRGLLKLDAPISDYLPAFKTVRIPFSNSPEITTRMLLTMSAGFPTDDKWADRQESLTSDEFHALIQSGFRFDTVPNTKFEYSNLGYALTAAIISTITKMPFTDFVTEEILTPLNMTSSGFDFNRLKNLATGYVKRNEIWEMEPFTGEGAFSAIGGLLTNIDDLAKWVGFLIQSFDEGLADGNHLIAAASRREMQQGQRVIPPAQLTRLNEVGIISACYGLGLFVEEDSDFGTIVSHSGGYPGYGSHMRWQVGSKIGVIALANGRYAAPVIASAKALRYLLQKDAIAKASTLPSKELQEFQLAVNSLIQNWNDSIADQIFANNMELDHPHSYRKSELNRSIEEIDGLLNDPVATNIKSNSASHLSWQLAGNHGSLGVEILLGPGLPAQIQMLNISTIAPAT